jgi:hypothetical protein
MELTVLSVPDCPNAAVLDERLAIVLAGRPEIAVTRHVIDDEEQAVRYGMHGSPTLLIDGADPFADPRVPASMSCRLYRGTGGRVDGAPSVIELRRALETPTS